MPSENYYKKMLIFGALWNFIVSSSLLLAIALDLQVWDQFGVTKPPSLVWLQGYLMFVFCYGIGYYIVSRNLAENHAAILIGIIAKLTVFIEMLYYLIVGDIGIAVFLIGIGDLIWAILFIEFLIHYKKK